MSLIRRLEREILGFEKHIEKENMQIDKLYDKMVSKKITGGDFSIKKEKIEDKIRAMKSRIRVLHGELAKIKRHMIEENDSK